MPTPTEQLCSGCEYLSVGPLADGLYCKAPEAEGCTREGLIPPEHLENLMAPAGRAPTDPLLRALLQQTYALGQLKGTEKAHALDEAAYQTPRSLLINLHGWVTGRAERRLSSDATHGYDHDAVAAELDAVISELERRWPWLKATTGGD